MVINLKGILIDIRRKGEAMIAMMILKKIFEVMDPVEGLVCIIWRVAVLLVKRISILTFVRKYFMLFVKPITIFVNRIIL